MTDTFRRISRAISTACGTWQAFALNLALVMAWAVCGPFLHWSDTWQLVCNTATTVITYLLVFLVMNTQSRDTAQFNLKLDTLIAALPRANNRMIEIDDLTDTQITQLKQQVKEMAQVD